MDLTQFGSLVLFWAVSVLCCLFLSVGCLPFPEVQLQFCLWSRGCLWIPPRWTRVAKAPPAERWIVPSYVPIDPNLLHVPHWRSDFLPSHYPLDTWWPHSGVKAE